jgi:hypothetical protein
MPRKKAVEHPDDVEIDLAPAVTPQQLGELSALGYRGPTPSTHPQAAALLQRLEAERQQLVEPGKP